jgi:hypothetical protein
MTMSETKKRRTTLEEVLEAIEAADSVDEAATSLGIEVLSLKQRMKKIRETYPALKLKEFTTQRSNAMPNQDVAARILARIRGVEVAEVTVQDEQTEQSEEPKPPALSEAEGA